VEGKGFGFTGHLGAGVEPVSNDKQKSMVFYCFIFLWLPTVIVFMTFIN
jgi:hypothetical protein